MKKLIAILLLCVGIANGIQGNELDKEKWKEASHGLSYPVPVQDFQPRSPQKLEVETEENPVYDQPISRRESVQRDVELQPPPASFQLGPVGQIILFVVLGAVLLALIFFLVKNRNQMGSGKKGSQQELRSVSDPDNPEELVRSELEIELDEARKSGNYARCLRYLFLMMLEQLQSDGKIVWHRHKTNGEYMMELLDHPDFPTIRQLTYIYEYHWYGEHPLTEFDYLELEPAFKRLIKHAAR
ncbi:MAG: DUF4129 domain-containing protein [Flavobacteriales bacterium]|nr:DUF4129 domain-containing protein [Bacteroidota bacterium]MCB9241428.1 DUF4129 domain-containing protein [Flavobacteriales bacterium]